jgi:hypothetical protein
MGLLSHWNCKLKVVSRVYLVQLLASLNTHDSHSVAQMVTRKERSKDHQTDTERRKRKNKERHKSGATLMKWKNKTLSVVDW